METKGLTDLQLRALVMDEVRMEKACAGLSTINTVPNRRDLSAWRVRCLGERAMSKQWRVDRQAPCNVYAGEEPVAMFRREEWAQEAVEAVNRMRELEAERDRLRDQLDFITAQHNLERERASRWAAIVRETPAAMEKLKAESKL